MVCFTSGPDELGGCCCCLSNEYIHTLQGICQCLASCRGNISDELRVEILIPYRLNQRAQVMETRSGGEGIGTFYYLIFF